MSAEPERDMLLSKHFIIDRFGSSQAVGMAAQLLQSYGEKKPDEAYSRLEKLVRGMPARLRACRERSYVRCGK